MFSNTVYILIYVRVNLSCIVNAYKGCVNKYTAGINVYRVCYSMPAQKLSTYVKPTEK